MIFCTTHFFCINIPNKFHKSKHMVLIPGKDLSIMAAWVQDTFIAGNDRIPVHYKLPSTAMATGMQHRYFPTGIPDHFST